MLRNNLRKNHNMSVETYRELLESQNGKCLICGREFNGVGVANIDHDHTTGKIRGVLCKACNRGLGMFKDDINLLLKAVVYLNSFLSAPIPLALIDREKQVSHETCYDVGVEEPWKGEYQTAFRNGQRHLIHSGWKAIIPLAEALKTVDP